jgi:hypothetical protein
MYGNYLVKYDIDWMDIIIEWSSLFIPLMLTTVSILQAYEWLTMLHIGKS